MAFFTRPQSANAAIKIVRPTTAVDDDQLKGPSRKAPVQEYHDLRAPDAILSAPRAESPATGTSPTLTAKAVNAPVFVPKMAVRIQTSTPPPENPPSPQLQPQYTDDQQQQQQEAYDEYAAYPTNDDMNNSFYSDAHYDPRDGPVLRDPTATRALRAPACDSAIPVAFSASTTDGQFIPPSAELRTLLQGRSEDLRMAPPQGLNLPEEMQGYHSLVPLENLAGTGERERRKFGNWNSSVYRAINSVDGGTYCLRRIENYRLTHHAAFGAIETWAAIRHPGVVAVHEAFTTHAFGDSSLVVAYAYHPGAKTLFDAHLKPAPATAAPTSGYPRQPPTTTYTYQRGGGVSQHQGQQGQGEQGQPIPERMMWSYIVQLAGAIKRVHDAGQAVRMIDVTKVLVTSKNRVRVSSCGIVDVLMYDSTHPQSQSQQHAQSQPHTQDMHLLQQEDLTMFGAPALRAVHRGPRHLWRGRAWRRWGASTAPRSRASALFLVNKGGPHKSIGQLLEIVSSRVVGEMGDALGAADTLENELMGELENARLVRLLCKFGFINERPEFAREPRWSETGDRYIVKLFRDYVFHRSTKTGTPVVNLAHVLTCLSKLDAGTEERVMLVSRDEQSCLVVSYKEIKLCVESAFSELARAGSANNGTGGVGGGGGYR
ncbi:hypothetical protein B0H14DRAFT_2561602 [Mycena olivaceomarginata]|nr:hypothetical protein B0H14DRAFT_2561602 [Mycena olivaceomarginata]